MNPTDPSLMVSSREEREEARLVCALRAGEDSAYEELVRLHTGRLLAVARRFVRNPEDAQDVVQEAFISAFRSLDRFEGTARLSTWLHRIVVNAALMRLRSRRRAPEDSIEDLLPKFLEDGHAEHSSREWGMSGEEAIQQAQTRQLVRQCIERLPESYRLVLILRDIEEMDTEEAAKLMGITANAVKIRLHRARQALRGLLDPHFREGGA
ncbi:MAG: sigma-70 family RNA polymerase sigma factor [Acidobacteria bacterium]|nr:sigma-70 family RNA polymerase sigma factor [Acidobacteriota bacterium]